MMEKNVVTLETAKKLVLAGFPQDTAVAWIERPRNKPEYRWELAMPWQGTHLKDCPAAPTAQEIADQLEPAKLFKQYGLLTVKHGPKGVPHWPQEGAKAWGAAYFIGGEAQEPIGMGDTMAEALAALWIKLQEVQS
jgi:sugar/nucleoside kinase (ribokinase family)